MRVLFLTESFYPVLGGGETHIRQLGSALVLGGADVTVVTRRGRPSWSRADEVDGVRIVRVPPTGQARLGKYLMVGPAFAATLREARRHDVVVVRGTRVLGLPGLLAARLAGCPVVLQPEINGEFSGEAFVWGQRALRGGPLRRALLGAVSGRNFLFRDASAFVAMSRAIEDEALAAGFERERVRLIPHGVDVVRFSPVERTERLRLRVDLGLPAAAQVLVYTGRLLRGKGLGMLLEAFAPVAREHACAHLVLVGAGEEQALSVESALRARVRGDDLAGRVTFAGRVETVERWLRAADAFVFPSEYEALGISLLEAAACGLPCLGSRTGGIVDVIEDGRSGRLLPAGDAAAWTQAMVEVLGNPAQSERWGTRGREIVVARFCARESAAAYSALFLELRASGVSRLHCGRTCHRGRQRQSP